jgi:hypothetical protein
MLFPSISPLKLRNNAYEIDGVFQNDPSHKSNTEET